MFCPQCKSPLKISKSYMTFKNDNTADLPTEAYQNHVMVCGNSSCQNYAGKDLSNPIIIAKTVSHKINCGTQPSVFSMS